MMPFEVVAREALLSARTDERSVNFILKIACVLLVQLGYVRGEDGASKQRQDKLLEGSRLR